LDAGVSVEAEPEREAWRLNAKLGELMMQYDFCGWSALSAPLPCEIRPFCLCPWFIPFAAQYVIKEAAQNRGRSSHPFIYAVSGQNYLI
jgi:hypothetical protein